MNFFKKNLSPGGYVTVRRSRSIFTVHLHFKHSKILSQHLQIKGKAHYSQRRKHINAHGVGLRTPQNPTSIKGRLLIILVDEIPLTKKKTDGAPYRFTRMELGEIFRRTKSI